MNKTELAAVALWALVIGIAISPFFGASQEEPSQEEPYELYCVEWVTDDGNSIHITDFNEHTARYICSMQRSSIITLVDSTETKEYSCITRTTDPYVIGEFDVNCFAWTDTETRLGRMCSGLEGTQTFPIFNEDYEGFE